MTLIRLWTRTMTRQKELLQSDHDEAGQIPTVRA